MSQQKMDSGLKSEFWRNLWQRVVPKRARLLRNPYFWIIAGVALFAAASFYASLIFTDLAILGFVLLMWVLFATILVLHSTRQAQNQPPSVPEVEKWEQYEARVRELAAKVQQGRNSKIPAYILAKKMAADLGWKRNAVASATVSIRSRSFFRESEEGADETVIASQSCNSW